MRSPSSIVRRSSWFTIVAAVVLVAAACVPPPPQGPPEPQLTVPAELTVPAASPSGAVVEFETTAVDTTDGVLPVTCVPPSGSLFAIGTTQVSCSATNSQGGTRTRSFLVVVLPFTPPTAVGPDAVGVDAGGQHSCAAFADGTVRCWGVNTQGQLGNGSVEPSFTPVPVPLIDDAVAVSAGARHSCALHADGTVSCWGANNDGQSGLGSGPNDDRDVRAPRKVTGITGAVAISAGDGDLGTFGGIGELRDTSCAVIDDGAVRCWGRLAGVSGNPTPTALAGITDAIDVAAGAGHACALLADGTVQCAGRNGSGQLGDGTTTDSATPVPVTGITDAVAIDAGRFSTCAVLVDGAARCWGSNNFGQLGNGTTTSNSPTPVPVAGITAAVSISTGGHHSCATLADGTARCWGLNVHGELGDGTESVASPAPVPVSGLDDAVAVAAGGSQFALVVISHTCALRTNGDLRCWGADNGQLGRGAVDVMAGIPTAPPPTSGDPLVPFSATPVDVVGLRGPTSISTRSNHTCAVQADGTVGCWGQNTAGQLGGGSVGGSSSTPITVVGIDSAIAVAAGGAHSCALLADGTVRCWGSNSFGQLGNGTTGGNVGSPVVVSGISDAVAIAAGGDHTCALLATGGVRCWGQNSAGQLGLGTTTGTATVPAPVVGLPPDVSGITAGASHTCARHDERAFVGDTPEPAGARCWGANDTGQLGNGSTGPVSGVPTPVVSLPTSFGSLVGGEDLTCASGSGASTGPRCWGRSDLGQLGNGTLGDSPTPVVVLGLSVSGVRISGAGARHACHRSSDAPTLPADPGASVRLACTGANGLGQLGNGASGPASSQSTPVLVVGMGPVAQVDGGSAHTCALEIGATPVLQPRCWGGNGAGQLGDGTDVPSPVPVAVVGLN